MARYIDKETADKWKEVAALLYRAADAVAEAETKLLTELGIKDGKPMESIQAAGEALSGLPYQFTPQSEWQGRDQNDNAIYKIRPPHIAGQ